MLSRATDKIAYFRLIRTCWRLSPPQRPRMVLIWGLLVLTNAVGLTRPIIVGGIVATVAKAGSHFYHDLVLWLLAMVGSMMLYWLLIGPVRIQERKLAVSLKQTLTETLYDDVTRLPWEWHQAHHTGDTLSRINGARVVRGAG